MLICEGEGLLVVRCRANFSFEPDGSVLKAVEN